MSPDDRAAGDLSNTRPTMAILNPITLPYYIGAPWLPTYSGDAQRSNRNTFTEFKNKMESMFRLYPLSETQQVEILIGQLKGTALKEVTLWPVDQRKTVVRILNQLATTFDTRTLSELKVAFYTRKQQPGETLRDFALSLQEALKALQSLDPTEIRPTDEILINQFIEGSHGEIVKMHLRLLQLQLLNSSFLSFKEAAIKVVGTLQQQEMSCPEMLGYQENKYPAEIMKKEIMDQHTLEQVVLQGAPAPWTDLLSTIGVQVDELTHGITEMSKQLRYLRQQQAKYRLETKWNTDKGQPRDVDICPVVQNQMEVDATLATDPEPEVSARKVIGKVVWFNVRNGYGFINWHDTRQDVFVHYTSIQRHKPRKYQSLGDGEIVEFDIIHGEKGLYATNVTGLGGVPVKGSRYAPDRKRYWRYPRRRGFSHYYPQTDQNYEDEEQSKEAENVTESIYHQQPFRGHRNSTYDPRTPYGCTQRYTAVTEHSELPGQTDEQIMEERTGIVKQSQHDVFRPQLPPEPVGEGKAQVEDIGSNTTYLDQADSNASDQEKKHKGICSH
ncbi:uncharacterized protein LOC134909372 [Pseudophryne corroboree]|uniref:uncharacterized protein LOC134909372 n=1 Tax=Pseudophryne corroboree TaxID=495146 RepID=UPI003081F1CB